MSAERKSDGIETTGETPGETDLMGGGEQGAGLIMPKENLWRTMESRI